MRTVEGIGRVAPTPVRVPIYPGDRWEGARVASDRVEFRQYEELPSEWRVGLLGDSRKSVQVGYVGEVAFARWASGVIGRTVAVDTARRAAGDGDVDFIIFGYKIQVKTATTDYSELLVRAGHVERAAWDIIVRVHYPCRKSVSTTGLFGPLSGRDQSAAELCGWIRLAHFHRLSVSKPARRGNHINAELESIYFQPMSELADLLTARRLRETV